MINPNNLCPGCMNELKTGEKFCAKCGYHIGAEAVNPRCLPPYTVLAGKYLLGKVLGEGGFGVTYLGWDLNLEMKVAIKEYFPTGLATRDTTNATVTQLQILPGNAKNYFEKGLAKYTEEAKLLSRFSKEDGIVSIKDYIYENGTAYIVMEYIDGESLKDEMERMNYPYSEALVMKRIMPILNVLERVHEVGIMHRDISPDNIMIEKNGKVRLIDFGAARVATGDDNKSLTIMLKHGYAPEEQYRTKGSQGPWTDVYSICATMYRMLTGEVPEDAMDRLYQDKLKPVSQFQNDCSPEINRIIMKGLSVRADNRYQSIRELKKELVAIPSSHVRQEPHLQAQQTLPVQTGRQEWEKSVQAMKADQIHSGQEEKKSRMGALIALVLIVGYVLVLIAGLASDDGNASTETSAEMEQPAGDDYEEIIFEDAGVEAAVRESLGKPTETIFKSDMKSIVSLECNGCFKLTDLMTCENLEVLVINGSNLYNLCGIINLTKLKTLGIYDTSVSNISEIQNLFNLEELALVNIELYDISSIGQLTNLEWLDINNNNITDISGLSQLSKLEAIDISDNPIYTISPLSELPMLNEVWMIDIPATDAYDRYLPRVEWVFQRRLTRGEYIHMYESTSTDSKIVGDISPREFFLCGPVYSGGISDWQMVKYGGTFGYIFDSWDGTY